MPIDLYQLTPEGKLSFRLHPGQARAWRSTKRFTFVIAGTQGGKTSFIPLWLDREIHECGHGDYLAATATYDLYKLKFIPVMRSYFVDLFNWTEDKSDRVFWRLYKPRMFDRIILRSAASEGGLESATAKAAVLDECGQDEFRVGAWEAVQRRLALAQGRVLGATTPYNLGWLKTEIYDPWRKQSPDIAVVQFRSIENPAFPRAEYDRAKATLPGWKFQMFYNGAFARPAGMIYEDFSDIENIVDDFPIPPEWPRYVGFDFGPVHMASVWLAQDRKTNTYYLYRETLEGGLTTKQHAQAARRRAIGENVVRWTGGAGSEDQYRRDFAEGGVPIQEPKVKDVDPGIDRVIELVKARRLKVFRSCKGVVDEFGTYARELDEMGQPTVKIKDKQNFHYLDALRYDTVGISDGPFVIFGG